MRTRSLKKRSVQLSRDATLFNTKQVTWSIRKKGASDLTETWEYLVGILRIRLKASFCSVDLSRRLNAASSDVAPQCPSIARAIFSMKRQVD